MQRRTLLLGAGRKNPALPEGVERAVILAMLNRIEDINLKMRIWLDFKGLRKILLVLVFQNICIGFSILLYLFYQYKYI